MLKHNIIKMFKIQFNKKSKIKIMNWFNLKKMRKMKELNKKKQFQKKFKSNKAKNNIKKYSLGKLLLRIIGYTTFFLNLFRFKIILLILN